MRKARDRVRKAGAGRVPAGGERWARLLAPLLPVVTREVRVSEPAFPVRLETGNRELLCPFFGRSAAMREVESYVLQTFSRRFRVCTGKDARDGSARDCVAHQTVRKTRFALRGRSNGSASAVDPVCDLPVNPASDRLLDGSTAVIRAKMPCRSTPARPDRHG